MGAGSDSGLGSTAPDIVVERISFGSRTGSRELFWRVVAARRGEGRGELALPRCVGVIPPPVRSQDRRPRADLLVPKRRSLSSRRHAPRGSVSPTTDARWSRRISTAMATGSDVRRTSPIVRSSREGPRRSMGSSGSRGSAEPGPSGQSFAGGEIVRAARHRRRRILVGRPRGTTSVPVDRPRGDLVRGRTERSSA